MKVEISDKLLELFKARAEEKQMSLSDYVERVLSEVGTTLELLHLAHSQRRRIELGYDKEEGWWVQLCQPQERLCIRDTDEWAGNAIAKVVAKAKRNEWKPISLDLDELEAAMLRLVTAQIGQQLHEYQCYARVWYTDDDKWAIQVVRDSDGRHTQTYTEQHRPGAGIAKALAEIETWQNEWR